MPSGASSTVSNQATTRGRPCGSPATAAGLFGTLLVSATCKYRFGYRFEKEESLFASSKKRM